MAGLRLAFLVLAFAVILAQPAQDARGLQELKPDLYLPDPTNVQICAAGGGCTAWSSGPKQLKLTTTIVNIGMGPFEAVFTTPVALGQPVYQRVYNDDGSYQDYFAGYMDYHPGHTHVHLNDFVRYVLRSTGPGTQEERVSDPAPFCINDTDHWNPNLPGSPPARVYDNCFADHGISVGWAAIITPAQTQSIDITGLPDGVYFLTLTADPRSRLRELNETNNVSDGLMVNINGPAVTQAPRGTETCNGLDNDGDSLIDEGYPNNDNDAQADCVDPDDDNDGYTDAQEVQMSPGQDPFLFCSIMRSDVDGDGTVTISDLALVAGQFLQSVPPGTPRYDQGMSPDGVITISDLATMAGQFLQPISACPN